MFMALLFSYAEVRAEQRRELGIEESQPEITADKASLSSNPLAVSCRSYRKQRFDILSP